MRGIPSSLLMFFFALVLIVELTSYTGICVLISKYSSKLKAACTVSYLLFSGAATSLLVYFFSSPDIIRQARDYHIFYLVVIVSILNLFPKFFFSLVTLFSLLFRFLVGKRMQINILTGGSILSLAIFAVILTGVFYEPLRTETHTEHLYFNDLPSQLDGFRIVQVSDIHLGTLNKDTRVIQKAVAISESLNPDLFVFTGDIVNNFGDEIDGYGRYLSAFSGKYGKFAILGNHDYGDYYQWPDSAAKRENLESIKNGLTKAGFRLLLNQSIKIEVKDTSFVLIGVENWGHRPFPQYADLTKAMTNVQNKSFKILMSHDPAHWEAVVVPKTDIPLTLSGHTHGGQFGIKIAGIEFSPIYFIQKYWGGLYKVDNQYLYVNRGLGEIGFAGRIEMKPEITLVVLHRTKSH